MNNEEKNDFYDKFDARLKQQEEEDAKKVFVRRRGAAGETSNFLAEIEKTMIEKKLSRGKATRLVIAEQPRLHEIWLLESQNKIKKEK